MANVQIKTVKLDEVKPNPDNPRKISKAKMDKLVKSLREFPEMMEMREIVVDETMTILGGNMRFEALRKTGAKKCTVKIVVGLTPAQKREFIVKDNASFGEWIVDDLLEWNIPLDDWGVDLKIEDNTVDVQDIYIPRETSGDMRTNFNKGKGEDSVLGLSNNPDKYPVTFVLSEEEWNIWNAIKNKIGVRNDKTAFLKIIQEAPHA